MSHVRVTVALILFTLAAGAAHAQTAHLPFPEWKAHHEKDIRSRWLPLVGLFWLTEGENPFGSDPKLAIPLPKGTVPASAGSIRLEKGTVFVVPAANVQAQVNGKPVAGRASLSPNANGKPDQLTIGPLTMFVIQRGDRFAIRARHANSPAARAYKFTYFPVESKYRITARFVPHDRPREVAIPTVIGTDWKAVSPGYVTFTLDGREHRLEPVLETPDAKELMFVFRDSTAGKGTYPGGRFLYTPMPENGQVVLDFNRAENPPCAYTPFATCPLPPKQNMLEIAIPAGEKYQGKH